MHFHRSALAAALLLAATPLAAQDNPGVMTGTITLDRAPEQRVQLILNRKARLGVVVLVDVSPATDSIGAVLMALTPNGAAYRAGLRVGDIVTRFNGKPIADVAVTTTARAETSIPGLRLIEMTAGMSPGDSATVQYRRGAAVRQTTVVVSDEPAQPIITEWPAPARATVRTRELPRRDTFAIQLDSVLMPPMATAPMMRRRGVNTTWSQVWVNGSPLANVEIVPLNPELGRYFGTSEGVLVINLPNDSKLGLKPGDVVLAIDGREFKSPNQMMRALMSYDVNDTISIQIMRQKARMRVTGTIE
jgi:predicted metalloprotease with PDZ domain